MTTSGPSASGADERDTGITDLQAQVDYMAANAAERAAGGRLQPARGQRHLPARRSGEVRAPGQVAFDLASLAMTAPGDLQDATVTVELDGQELGTFPVTNTAGSQPNDEAGTAAVSFAARRLPDGPPSCTWSVPRPAPT